MATHADRPKPIKEPFRRWIIYFHDGTTVTVLADHRGAARHYSKSCREELVSSRDHYRDVRSARLIRTQQVEDDCPF